MQHDSTIEARIKAQIEVLFQKAFQLGCECEELRDGDREAYMAKVRELRYAVDEHREAVKMWNSYLK
jgi:hypothetical protein